MKRRTYLRSALAGAGAIASAASQRLKAAAGDGGKIQLHVDLGVDPAKEAEMDCWRKMETLGAAWAQVVSTVPMRSSQGSPCSSRVR